MSSGNDTAPVPPPAPAPDAPPEDLAAWREQQSRWKTEHAAWKQQQAASARELRDQRATEAHARAVARSVNYDERRRLRRLANPRVTGSHVVITLGAALIIGGVAALLSQSGDGWNGYGVVVGLAAATITVGVSVIVAGIARRRSGFLGFVALLLAASTVLVSFVPPDRTVVVWSYGTTLQTSGRYAQAAGTFTLYSTDNTSHHDPSVIDLWQGAGDVSIGVPAGMTVRVVADLGSPALEQSRYEKARKSKTTDEDSWNYVTVPTSSTRTANGRYSYDITAGSGTPTVTVHIWQGNGDVRIEQQPDTAQPSSAPSINQETGMAQ